MAENMDRGSFDKILSSKDMEDEKTRDKFFKNLSKEDLEEGKLTNIVKMFRVMKEIL